YLRHHFRLYYNGLSYHSDTFHLRDTSSYRFYQITSENNRISRIYLRSKTYFVYFQEISKIVFWVWNGAQYQNSACLRHCFNLNNTRENRSAREMTFEELFVHSNIFYPYHIALS